MEPNALFTRGFLAQAGDDFAATRLGQDFVRADLGAESVDALLSWADLNDILTTRPLEVPRLRLFRDGAQVPVERYTRGDPVAPNQRPVINPDELYRELRDGASLIIDAIDKLHRPIGAAADDLMRLVGELVQVNLYLVWGEGQGFNTHWDDHDTMIVQVAGEKRWTVHGVGRPFPMKVDADRDHEPPEGIVWDGVIRPGEILHVPRGWWHTVRGTGEMSMHLTFGFTRRTGIDWATWVVEQLHEEELFRQDLPRFADAEARRDRYDELTRSLAKLVASHPPDDFLAARDRRFPRRPEINLPWPVSFTCPDDSSVLIRTPIIDPTLDHNEKAASLTVSGRTYRFAPILAPLLEHLATHRQSTIGELRHASGLEDATFSSAVELLVHNHLAVIR